MEPQIIQYYNELPYYAEVIQKLNDEYEELLVETQNNFIEYNFYKFQYNILKKKFKEFKKNKKIEMMRAFSFSISFVSISIVLIMVNNLSKR